MKEVKIIKRTFLMPNKLFSNSSQQITRPTTSVDPCRHHNNYVASACETQTPSSDFTKAQPRLTFKKSKVKTSQCPSFQLKLAVS